MPVPPAVADDPLPRVPPGFAVTAYQHMQGVGTSLAFGKDTRDGSGTRLYVTDFAQGRVMVIDDTAGVAGPPAVFATGFRNPLGVVAGSDGTVYVADAEALRPGPFGSRAYGRVWRIPDANQDGVGDAKQLLLKDLPNGRHNTNGMAFGPDGMLYVTNGNSTDNGIVGGEPEAKPWSGSVIRVDPAAANVSVADLDPAEALVASGMRNVYDVAFSPVDPTQAFIPMNGADDPESDDLLYATDVDDTRTVTDPDTGLPVEEQVIDDYGFPSCLYNESARGNLEPYNNPHAPTIAQYGECPIETVPRPVSSYGLHVSANGSAFQTTDAWGADYKNDLFTAEWGNLFGTTPVGHEVVRVELTANGDQVLRQSEFLSGAAPIDVVFDSSGAMYALDFSGVIFKVTRVVEVPQTIEVQMNAFQFAPAVLTIPQGTIIKWSNKDVLGLPHNVRAQAAIRPTGAVETGSEIDSDSLNVGGNSHQFRFDEPGTWVYTCTLGLQHEALMHGKITVVPAGS
ncbi:MAG: plastocyanin/azurin family copper-binding protein [Actinomycetota bacterium]